MNQAGQAVEVYTVQSATYGVESVMGLLLALWMTHPLVVVDGETTCPTPAEIEVRVVTLLPAVDERESQHRAVVELTAAGLFVDLRGDDGERLAHRQLAATGSCADLAAAAAVVIAAWEVRLKPEIAGRVSLPAQGQSPTIVPTTAEPARPRAAIDVEARLGLLAGIAGGDIAPGATVEGSFTPRGRRLGGTIGLWGAAPREQVLASSGSTRARWMRAALAAGPNYRLRVPGQLDVDLHVDGLLGMLHVEGASTGVMVSNPAATWSLQSDLTTELGVAAGIRATRAWGAFAAFVGVSVQAWPGHERLVVKGDPAAAGELPRFEGQLAAGAGWRRFP